MACDCSCYLYVVVVSIFFCIAEHLLSSLHVAANLS